MWARAIAWDDKARAATGTPVSVRRQRQELHIGPHSAARVHERLAVRRQLNTGRQLNTDSNAR
ncbi:hypothetical protein [Streptomyces phaeochromogenes]|uniref:hypothetical protein n=1 Tax=Streptomyces phaeochromogenes TaxID=1923 RepID=UPI003869FDAE|nr:hypothetical protein OG277_41845 [Streptomyces phaeochromogenes]